MSIVVLIEMGNLTFECSSLADFDAGNTSRVTATEAEMVLLDLSTLMHSPLNCLYKPDTQWCLVQFSLAIIFPKVNQVMMRKNKTKHAMFF